MGLIIKETTSEKSGDIEGRSLGIWELAWPAILNNLLFSLIGLVSIKMVGNLGPDAVAAVATGQRVFFGLFAVLLAISAGTTALVARAIGSGDSDEAAQVTRASLGLCLLISFVTVILLWIGADGMIGLFGLDEASKELSITYTQIL